ncbi:MAG: cytochrome c biogenesis protein ResB [Candidatus Melainabacteria bacterium]|nr:cytochrome c biogenesis protein ResB [Candidatus Melainabacteria bacterium]
MSKVKKFLVEIKNAFLDEFSSVKLAIALFFALAIATLVGTILPEEPMVGTTELLKQYGPEKYKLMKSIGFTDVFHSWWYLALLTMLGINLTVASFRRVFPKAYLAFTWPVELKIENIAKLPISSELPVSNESFIRKIQEILQLKHYKTKLTENKLFAVKGGWHRLGASITHVGILILLIGSTVSILTGFNGMVQLKENEGFYLTNSDQVTSQMKSPEPSIWMVPVSKMPIWFGTVPSYLVKINKTYRENYKTGEPKQWYTDLSVFDENNKKELVRKEIYVNNPLQFMGLDIYQSNWGKFANITFNGELVSLPVENTKNGEEILLPLSDDIFFIFNFDKNKMKVSSALMKSQEEVTNKFLGELASGESIKIGPLEVGFHGIETVTGLQFKSNPGDVMIYLAIGFIFAGVFIAFGSKRQIWVYYDNVAQKIVLGGSVDRARENFYREFEDIVYKLANDNQAISKPKVLVKM